MGDEDEDSLAEDPEKKKKKEKKKEEDDEDSLAQDPEKKKKKEKKKKEEDDEDSLAQSGKPGLTQLTEDVEAFSTDDSMYQEEVEFFKNIKEDLKEMDSQQDVLLK